MVPDWTSAHPGHASIPQPLSGRTTTPTICPFHWLHPTPHHLSWFSWLSWLSFCTHQALRRKTEFKANPNLCVIQIFGLFCERHRCGRLEKLGQGMGQRGARSPQCHSARWLQLHPAAPESPEFIWGQNMRLAAGEGTAGAVVPRESCARDVTVEQRRYLPAWLALGAHHSSGSLVPGVAPEPRGPCQAPSPLRALQGTERGHCSPLSSAGPEQLCKSPWSLFHSKAPRITDTFNEKSFH